ncbi:hypothetical protein N2152v2_006143 [Parachlorella kessleri]
MAAVSLGCVSVRPSSLYSRSRAFSIPRAGRARAVVVRSGLGEQLAGFAKKLDLNEGKKMFTISLAGDYDQGATKSKIDKLIADNPVMVFSWSGCPYCKKAKALLDEVGAKYTALELDQIDDGKAIRAELARQTGRTSVPNIWISGQNVGGCNDGPGVATLNNKGELKPMLKAAGAL